VRDRPRPRHLVRERPAPLALGHELAALRRRALPREPATGRRSRCDRPRRACALKGRPRRLSRRGRLATRQGSALAPRSVRDERRRGPRGLTRHHRLGVILPAPAAGMWRPAGGGAARLRRRGGRRTVGGRERHPTNAGGAPGRGGDHAGLGGDVDPRRLAGLGGRAGRTLAPGGRCRQNLRTARLALHAEPDPRDPGAAGGGAAGAAGRGGGDEQRAGRRRRPPRGPLLGARTGRARGAGRRARADLPRSPGAAGAGHGYAIGGASTPVSFTMLCGCGTPSPRRYRPRTSTASLLNSWLRSTSIVTWRRITIICWAGA